jgi:AsmA protein
MVATRRRHRVVGALLLVTAIALGVGLGGGVLLERWANQRKDQAVTALQARLGRPVKMGPLRVSWLRGFALETGDVELGARSALEPGPALRIEKVRLRVGLWRAVFSLGRRLQVKEARLTGVTGNVVRFADGSINWQQISARLQGPARSQPPSASERTRLRGLVIEHAAVDGAQVRFIDHVRAGARAEINDINLVADGIGFTEPFTAHLSAAVEGREKNLDVDAGFALKPEGTAPALRRVAIKLRPVDVAPLAPFLASGPLAELTEGRLAADLKIDVGAAVAGGQGPTTARGDVTLTGARIVQGERFDGAFESDLVADTVAGNVELRKLRLAMGAMSLSSAGKLLDLHGTPRFEKFAVTSNGLDFDTLRRYVPGLDRGGVALGGPFTVSATADADGGAQRFAARIDLTSASVVLPGKLDKPAGTKLSWEVTGQAEGQLIRCDEVLFTMGDARISGQGTLQPAVKHRRSFDGSLQAEPFAVRPLLALLGGAAAPPDLRVGGKVKARGTLGQPASMHVEVPSFQAASGSSHLSGSLTVDNLEHPVVALEARSPYLDLDDFLPAPKGDGAKAPATRSAPPLAGVQARARLAVDRGRAAGIEYQNLRGDLALTEGRLRASALEVTAFGGKFSGAGSEFPLSGEGSFVARGNVTGMDLAALLAHFAPDSPVLSGTLSAELDVAGQGLRTAALARSLTGKVSGSVSGAELQPAALLEPVTKSLARAVKVPPLAALLDGAGPRVPALRDHALGDLTGAARFADGALLLIRPLEAHAPYGALSFGGKVLLDGRADLTGTVAVAPEVLAAITGGKATFAEPLPINVHITGPLRTPRITPTEVDAPARALVSAFSTSAALAPVREDAQGAVDKAREAAGRRLRRILPH